MQLRLVTSVIPVPFREIRNLDVPRHMAGAQHVDNTEIVQTRLKVHLLQAPGDPASCYFGLKEFKVPNYTNRAHSNQNNRSRRNELRPKTNALFISLLT